jgi:hypothetical protein
MDVKLIQARVTAITTKLNLKLQLIILHGEVADRTLNTDPWPTPGPIGTSAREFAIFDCCAGLFTKLSLVHLALPTLSARGPCVTR